jgi:hypothetical protein
MARADHGFDFFCRSDTAVQIQPGEAADFWFTLTNTGSSNDVYAFDCRPLSCPVDWTIVYCLGGLCAGPGTVLYDSLSAGAQDTAISLHVYTSTTAGEAALMLHVRSQGDPLLADSAVLHVRAGVGILERVATHSARRTVAPNPVARGGILRLQQPGDVRLLDATGRPVAAGSATGGEWVVPADIAPGVLTIVLSGAASGVRLVVR